MKKITSWSSLLLLALFVVAFAACRHDDLASKAGADADQPTFAMDIDLEDIPILPLEERTITSTDTEDGSRDESKPQKARAFEFTVPAEGGGNYPKLSFSDGDKLPVRLILYPQGSYGDKVFYSKDPVELTVKNNKISFKMKGLEFIGGGGLDFSGKLAFDNKDQWRLTALYAPGSTATSGSNIINFTGKSPAKFLNPGEKLVVGRDINIPFVLGVRKADGSHEPGVSVTMIPDNQKINPKVDSNPEYNNPKNYRFEFKSTKSATDPEKEGFYPLGTLFAMRFRNDMKSIKEKEKDMLMDEGIWNKSNGSHERAMAVYDYTITKVTINSTTEQGQFDIGKSVEFTPTEATRRSFDLPKGQEVKLGLDEKETPWLYFWQYSQGGRDDSALELTFNLYNEDLGVHTMEKVYRARGSQFRGSYKYFKHLKIARELFLSPLASVGPTFASLIDERIIWADAWASNAEVGNDETGKRGVGRPYLAKELFDNNGRLLDKFTMNIHTDFPGFDKRTTYWKLPSEKEMRSIFPASIGGISVTDNGQAPTSEKIQEATQEVDINGFTIDDYAVYYTKGGWDIFGADQKSGNSLRVYYGLRYIGTRYVSAYRYIEWGRWNTNLSNPQDRSFASKYLIQSRGLPLSAGASYDAEHGYYVYDDTAAKNLLKNVIATNEFWSDRVKNNETLDIHNVTTIDNDPKNLKPDVIQRVFPLIGIWQNGQQKFIGAAFALWLMPPNGTTSWNGAKVFQVSNKDRPSMTVTQYDKKWGRAMVLPILAPGYGHH